MPGDVLWGDVLLLVTLCGVTFCGVTFCGVTFCRGTVNADDLFSIKKFNARTISDDMSIRSEYI